MFSGNGIVPVMDIDGNRDGAFGGGSWWAWIILFALFGWGGNGFGWGGNGGGQVGFTDAAIQRGFDNQAVISKLDGITNGICDASYAALAQTNGINQNIMQTGFGLQGSINDVSRQLADCCCTTQRSIDAVRYDMATDTCAVTTAVNQGFAQLDRTINDQFCQLKMEQKDAQIAAMQNQLNQASLAASQAAQNQYLVDQLRPCPSPAYVVPNPYHCNGSGYAYGNGCGGCGCN